MDILVRDAWIEESIQSGFTPLATSGSQSPEGSAERLLEGALKDENVMGVRLSQFHQDRQRLRNLSDMILEAPGSDECVDPHRYDIKLPFLVSEIEEFLKSDLNKM